MCCRSLGGWGLRGAGPDRSPRGGEAVPARRPPEPRSSPPGGGLRARRGEGWVRRRLPRLSGRPGPTRAARGPPSPCRRRRPAPAGSVRSSRAAPQPASPGRGDPWPVGRVWPRAQKPGARSPAGVLAGGGRPAWPRAGRGSGGPCGEVLIWGELSDVCGILYGLDRR